MTYVYYHGTIWTGRGADAEAMAVKDGKVLRIGTRREIEAGFGGPVSSDGRTDVTYRDLGGRFVVPGFCDSHLHLLNYGRTLSMVDLYSHTSSLAEIQDALRRRMEEESPKERGWMVGRGWNQDYFRQEKRFPTRYELDMVSTERPILIIRACGHVACANSKAIETAGISKATPQPEGGRFDVDEEGEPNGIFRENGVELINRAIPPPTEKEIKTYLVKAMENLNRFGITSVQSDDLAVFAGIPYETVLRAYRELEAQGAMTVKVYEQSMLPTMDLLKDFLNRGYCTGVGGAYFRIGPLKLLADGSLGARTAYLSQPYADDALHPDNQGIAIYSQDELNELACYGAARGMQLAIHAIGDQAMTVEEALKTYTEYGARASFEEDVKGLLLPGMAADFTILEEDLRRCEPQKIKDVTVCATVVDGRPVYIHEDAGRIFS